MNGLEVGTTFTQPLGKTRLRGGFDLNKWTQRNKIQLSQGVFHCDRILLLRIDMRVAKWFSVGVLLAAGFPATASSIASVSASLGSNTCSQSAPDAAHCNLSGTASAPGNVEATASASPDLGLVDLDLYVQGANANAFAGINDSNFLRVNGVTGSGSIQANFYGYDGTYINVPGAGSISPVSVTVGSFSTTFTMHRVSTDNTYPVIAPIDFGVLTPFTVSLTGTVSSTAYDSVYANSGFVNLFAPTFTVFDANGNVLPNASVEFYIPEPATSVFVALGMVALSLLLVGRARRQI